MRRPSAKGDGAVRARVRAGRRPRLRAADDVGARLSGGREPAGQRAAADSRTSSAPTSRSAAARAAARHARTAGRARSSSSWRSSQDIATRQQRELRGRRRQLAGRQPAQARRRSSWPASSKQVRTEIADSRNALARLTLRDGLAPRGVRRDSSAASREELAAVRSRKAMLDRDAVRDGNAMSVAAPCAGTVVKLHVRQPGAVVHEGDVLAEVVCVGRAAAGRADAARARHGARAARATGEAALRRVSLRALRRAVRRRCAGSARRRRSAPRAPAFRAFADLDAATVGVQGLQRAVLPGMTGRAAVIVGRRSLASYAHRAAAADARVARDRASGRGQPDAELVDGRAVTPARAHGLRLTRRHARRLLHRATPRCRRASSGRAWPRAPTCRS